jgi:hypothetical protein
MCIVAFVVAGFACVSNAALLCKVTAGQISVANAAGKNSTANTNSIEFGDTLSLGVNDQVELTLEKNTRLLMKGPLSAIVTNDNSTLMVALDDGQVLLDRNLPYEFSSIQITTRGYVFQPLGTAAAVRTSKTSYPATAVLRGKMKMQAPTGESVIVDKGNSGSIDKNGNLVTEKLSPEAENVLRSWGNISDMEDMQPAPVSQVSAEQDATPVSVQQDAAPTSQTVQLNQPVSDSVKRDQPGTNNVMPQTGSSVLSSKQQAAPIDTGDVKSKDEDNAGSKDDKGSEEPQKPQWEISAGTATVDNKQWTRVALGVDVPIWKFGVFFDLELFIDDKGKFSDKGWNFEDDWLDALSRKIRYIRFGHENDPLFIKIGGLSNVTLGYGFLMDRFTNMLHYPDDKQLGLQFYLNKVTPIGITLQTVVADFKDFKNDGGVVGARLALTPLKSSSIPLINKLTFGGSYVVDINQYAPARKWDYTLTGSLDDHDNDRDGDGIEDGDYIEDLFSDAGNALTSDERQNLIRKNRYDTLIEHKDKWASRSTDQFGLFGGDVGLPLITTNLLSLDLYGQAGIREDGVHGWGIGAPGVSLKVWRLWANVEYRHVEGKFTPGYFGSYYLDERIWRKPFITTKEMRLYDDNLNGIFGKLGFDIAGVLIIDGVYQYMVGTDDKNHKDQRFEAVAAVGDLIVKKIPKISKAEMYIQKSNIGSTPVKYDSISRSTTYDEFFEKTPSLYWGYRVGFAITEGAALIFDTRYGYKCDSKDQFKFVPYNNITIQTAITF